MNLVSIHNNILRVEVKKKLAPGDGYFRPVAAPRII